MLWTYLQTYLDGCEGSKAFTAEMSSTTPSSVSLKAMKNIEVGKILLFIPMGSLHITVTNSDISKIQNSKPENGRRVYYCDACEIACSLPLALDDPRNHNVPTIFSRPSVAEEEKASSTHNMPTTDEILALRNQAAKEGTQRREGKEAGTKKLLTARSRWSYQFRFCENSHQAPFCSEACHQASVMCSGSHL